MRVRYLRVLAAVLLVGALGLSACSQQEAESAADQAGDSVTSVAAEAGEAAIKAGDAAGEAATRATDAASSAVAAAGGKVDLNTASREEIEAALRENGVTDPDRWAAELEKLRPIEADQLGARLREELSKLDVDTQTLRGILESVRL